MSVGRKKAPRFRVGDVVLLLYGPQKVAGEIVEDRGLLGVYGRRLYRVRINRGEDDEMTFEIPEEDLLVPDPLVDQQETPGPRQEIDVIYVRSESSNSWTATIKRGNRYQGVKATGAVGYTTGKWEGEGIGEERRGTVTVFLKCDQTMFDSRSRLLPLARQQMAEEAIRLADQMFKRRHPDAVIVHDLDEG
jgi:hypothetical protein